jgi:flagellar M-ring protein FliF
MGGLNLETLFRNASAAVQRMSGPQRVTLALAFLATAMAVFLVTRVTGTTPMSTLYADLEPSTAAEIVQELDSQGVSYELENGGRMIKVPTNQVHAMRLNLSAQGLPNSGEGWSVLDDQGITTSAFDQRVGYQRAMEGELAKTIASIDGVASANVHLAIPEHDLIIDETKQASASVLLVTNGSQEVTPMQVDAIVNLVASSIEGLQADQVSVADESGQVLAAPGEGSGVVGLEGDTQLRAKRDYEATLEADLESLLSAVVGPGLAVVNVAADLDFDSVSTTTESYQPTADDDGAQMLLTETSREEIYRDESVPAVEDGELAVELPQDELGDGEVDPATDESVKYSLDERDATFAVDKVITSSESAAGQVTSLSVAVLLDEEAVEASRLSEIEELVEAAAGIDAERGDTLAVTLMPLSEEFRASAEALAAGEEAAASAGMDIVGLVRTVLAGLVALVVVILGLRYASRGSKREVIDSLELDALDGVVSSQAELTAGDPDREPPELRLESLIANQSDDVAGVLKTWLSDAEEVVR